MVKTPTRKYSKILYWYENYRINDAKLLKNVNEIWRTKKLRGYEL